MECQGKRLLVYYVQTVFYRLLCLLALNQTFLLLRVSHLRRLCCISAHTTVYPKTADRIRCYPRSSPYLSPFQACSCCWSCPMVLAARFLPKRFYHINKKKEVAKSSGDQQTIHPLCYLALFTGSTPPLQKHKGYANKNT